MSLRNLFIVGMGVVLTLALTGCAKKDEGRTAPARAGSAAAPIPATSEPSAVQTGTGGTLTGSVRYVGKPPKPSKLIIVKDSDVCGRDDRYDDGLLVGSGGGVRNAVVSILPNAGASGGNPLSALGTEFAFDQKRCVYEPHVLLVPVNTPIRIHNRDGILHNIHTYPRANTPQNIAQPPALKELELRFAQPERIQVRCDLHGWMSGWIVAVDHPYHALTDADGTFTLEGVPPGKYTVSCWHEVLGERTKEAEVSAGGSTSLDFTYP